MNISKAWVLLKFRVYDEGEAVEGDQAMLEGVGRERD